MALAIGRSGGAVVVNYLDDAEAATRVVADPLLGPGHQGHPSRQTSIRHGPTLGQGGGHRRALASRVRPLPRAGQLVVRKGRRTRQPLG
ncbi:MAG: hypothetical protein AAFN30_09095 [Actinomycetota bacterium]